VLQSQRVKQQFLKSFPLGLRFLFFGYINESDIIAHVEITVLGQIGAGRSLSSGDNIRSLAPRNI
jgi:hypothetical protein